VKKHWGKVLQIEQVFERIHGGHQDGVLLRKTN